MTHLADVMAEVVQNGQFPIVLVRGLIQTFLGSGRAIGLTITIFNPVLDRDGAIVRAFVTSLVAGLRHVAAPS